MTIDECWSIIEKSRQAWNFRGWPISIPPRTLHKKCTISKAFEPHSHSAYTRMFITFSSGATMRTKMRSARASTIPDPAQLEEQIRLRAYALYESRGRQDGRDRDDWLQAEAEILGRPQRAGAA